MDNPETQTTLNTKHRTNKIQNTTKRQLIAATIDNTLLRVVVGGRM